MYHRFGLRHRRKWARHRTAQGWKLFFLAPAATILLRSDAMESGQEEHGMNRVWYAALCLMCGTACQAPEAGMRLTLHAEELAVGEDFDSLTLTAVAAQVGPGAAASHLAYVCRVATRNWKDDELQLPLTVVIRAGHLPWNSVGLRARAFQAGRTVLLTEERFDADLRDGVSSYDIVLDGRCLDGHHQCDEPELCRPGGGCGPSPATTLFAVAPMDLDCDSNDETQPP